MKQKAAMTKLFLRSMELFFYYIALSLIIYKATKILFRAQAIDFIERPVNNQVLSLINLGQHFTLAMYHGFRLTTLPLIALINTTKVHVGYHLSGK